MQYLFLICSLFGQYVVIIVQRVQVKLFFSEVQPLAFSSLSDKKKKKKIIFFMPFYPKAWRYNFALKRSHRNESE